MCQSRITTKKFVKLLAEIEFYKITIYLIFLVTGYEVFSIKGCAKALLPIIGIKDGFVSCYLVFFLFIPFLNILIHHMEEKQHRYLLLLCGFTYIVMGTLPGFGITMNYVGWFMVLYLIAAYIRLYPRIYFNKTSLWGGLTVISIIVSACSVIACTWIGIQIDRKMAFYFLSDSNKILAVMTAVCAFLFFKNLKLKYSKGINTIAASTFGVLLIHANSDTMRQWLWKDTLNNAGMYGSPWLVVHAIGSVLGVYIVCTLIDYLRIRFVEKLFLRRWDVCMEKRKKNL